MRAPGAQSTQPKLIKLEIKTEDGSVRTYLAHPSQMTSAKIQKVFFDLVIDPRKEKEFNHQLRIALSKIIKERPISLLEGAYSGDTSLGKVKPGLYLQSSGWQRLPNGKMIFVAGDQVIGDCHIDKIINSDISGIHLPLIADISLESIVRTVIQGLNQNKTVHLVVWAFTLLTSIQSLILLAGIPLQCVLFVFGGQGVGKSTGVKQLFSVYEYLNSPGKQALFFDAGSSMPALREKLALFQDIPITVDDLCKSSDHEIQRQRRKLGGQLIRDCANKVVVTKMNGCSSEEYRVSAGVAITAEFSMEAASELTRTIPIHMKQRESSSLNNIRSYASSTLYCFLEWLAPQFDSLVRELETTYEQSQAEISSGKYPRVLTSKFALDWTFHVFCRFCEESANIEASETSKLYESYCFAIEQHIQELVQQVDEINATAKKGNVAWHILEGIQSGNLTLCEKSKHLPKHHGLKKDEKLYLWPEAVYQWITQQDGYRDHTKIKISKELKSQGVLIQEYDTASDNTVHLKVKGKRLRFLCLDSASLSKAAKIL
jgi:hypothetical protein